MKFKTWRGGLVLGLLGMVALAANGCGQADNSGGQIQEKGAKAQPIQVAEAKPDDKGHDHSGWWCAEHGVPEEVCGQCNAKVAAKFKENGDWCKEHDRPESQCFLCNPKLKEKFAAQYRAKYGKEPPPIEDEKQDDKSKKG